MLQGTAKDSEGASVSENTQRNTEGEQWPLPELVVSTGAIYAAESTVATGEYPTLRIALMDREEAATVPTQRDAYLHEMVKRCNAYPSMAAALARALEFMERVEAKEWEDGGAETMPEVEELREFLRNEANPIG